MIISYVPLHEAPTKPSNLNSKGKQCKICKQCKMPLEIHLHQIIFFSVVNFLKNAMITHGFKKSIPELSCITCRVSKSSFIFSVLCAESRTRWDNYECFRCKAFLLYLVMKQKMISGC